MSHPAGTTFVLRSGGTLGWLIRLLTRSRVNHAGLCRGDGHTIESQMAGAVSKTEQPPSTSVAYGGVFWYRLPLGRPAQIEREAEKLLGTPYNFLDLVALALAARKDPTDPPAKPNWWQRRVMRDDRLICSQLVDLAHLRAGVHLFTDGRLPGQVTPGDIMDVLANDAWPITVDP